MMFDKIVASPELVEAARVQLGLSQEEIKAWQDSLGHTLEREANIKRLEARIAELEAALRECRALITNRKLNLLQQFQGLQRVIAAALKGDADDEG
jgi:hypothetical protein